MKMNKFKKEFKALTLLAFAATLLCPAGNALDKNYSNNLLKVDLNKTSNNDVKLTLYTSKSYKVDLKPIKKSNNEYVVILPETYHSITSNPSIKNVNSSVKNVDIKLIPYIGKGQNNGYTKLTIKTDSDNVNFRVENKSVAASHSILNDTLDELTKITSSRPQIRNAKIASVSSVKIIKPFEKVSKQTTQVTKPKTIAMSLFKEPKKAIKSENPIVEKTKTQTQPKKLVNTTKIATTQITNKPIENLPTPKVTEKPVNTEIKKTETTAIIPVATPVAVRAQAPQPKPEVAKTQNQTQQTRPVVQTNKSQEQHSNNNLLAQIMIGILLFIGLKIFLKLKSTKKSFNYADVYQGASFDGDNVPLRVYETETVNETVLEELNLEKESWQNIYKTSQDEQQAKIEENKQQEIIQKDQHIEMLFEPKTAQLEEFDEELDASYLKEEFFIDNEIQEEQEEDKEWVQNIDYISQNPLPPAETILAKEVEPQNLFNEKYITREQSSEPDVLDVRNVAENAGFYLVDFENEKSLFGFINDNVYLINKFNDLKRTKIYTKKTERKHEKDIYLVQLEDWRALVSVSPDKIETMLEL